MREDTGMATFDLLADLELSVDGYALHGLHADITPDFERRTTLVQISGGDLTGVGEDVVYSSEEHLEYQALGAVHDLAGTRTIGEFGELIESLDLFPTAPQMEASRLYRVWAFESAALDLALLQNGLSLGQSLGREPRPMNYVASTGLGDPPTLEPVSKRLALDPTLRFKLDARSSWTPEIFEWLAASGAVDSIDFKGMYRGTSVDQPADPVLYRQVVDAFPDAWLEDPDLSSDEAMAVLADEHHRITWDAPIHAIADIEALPFAPRMVNIKPSRIGKLSELCATYDYCAAREIGAYGGGQTELGVGRGQAQYLAALFHPDTPNDLAPAAYNQMDPPPGLPRSPLAADNLTAPGFRWPE
jgi:L-alanine-DL-glutamate epimerase-like enolase superfamily enzyme